MATSIHETVLIGTCDGAIGKKKNTSYCTNKIGDRPVKETYFVHILGDCVMLTRLNALLDS